jgi:transcriptional regulator with XRE-family HTH domain
MDYAKAIRIARSIADITQGELAERSRLDRSYLSLIESGKRKPSVETLENIASALKIPFHLLTLLATEKKESPHIGDEQVHGLAKHLAYLLFEGLEKKDGGDSNRAGSEKLTRPRISTRSKKVSAA